MGFLIEDLITSIKYKSFVPVSQNTFQPSDIITIADENLLLKLVSDLFSQREDFFLKLKLTPITANYDHYPMPRSIGNAIKCLWFVDSAGNYYPIEKIDVDQKHKWIGMSGQPSKFYIEGDEVVILPMPSTSTGSLAFEYYAKPNRLVATSSCAKITGISSLAGFTTFTVDTDLTASLFVNSKIDFLSAIDPFLLWFDTITITDITATTISVATSDVTNSAGNIEVNLSDYICPNGKANIPMIPEEFHPVLAQMSAVSLLAGLGDLNKWQAAKSELVELRREALKLVKNRVESSPVRVSQRNGLLRVFRR